MGVTYVGWSETIDGDRIPHDAPPTRGPRVQAARHHEKIVLRRLRRARAAAKPSETRRKALLDRAIALSERTQAVLEKIPFLNR